MLSRSRRIRAFYMFLIVLMLLTLFRLIKYNLLNQPTPAYHLNAENCTYTFPIHVLPKDDYSRLINLTNFAFQIFEDVCQNSSPLLLVLIHTSPRNFERRKIIRETWGQVVDGMNILFVLGTVQKSTLQDKLKREREKHNDFIQGNFEDSYRNLTYKHVMVFKYVIYHCPEAKYILKTDDDVVVNIYALLDFLKKHLSLHGATNLLFCKLRIGAKVLRTDRVKWGVTVKEYPNRTYPPHCPGYAVMYSPDVIFRLYKEAQQAKYFWIDDVHITGTLAKKTNITITNAAPYMRFNTDVDTVLKKMGNQFMFGILTNGEDVYRLWKSLKSPS